MARYPACSVVVLPLICGRGRMVGQAYGIPNLASRFGFIPEMPMRAGVSTVPSGCLIDSEKRAETLLPPHP
eukprot:scaffold1523_cov426-Prasinococcus_capsulatus_cf.AAC.13